MIALLLQKKGYLVLAFLLLTLAVAPASAQLFWNQAASFEGSASSYVVVPYSAELDITGSFTIECWVNPDSTTGFRMLVNHRLGSASEGYAFYLNGGSRPFAPTAAHD